MHSFSKFSLDNLSTCHNELIMIMNEVLKTVDITVIKGFRNQSEQNNAVIHGNSRNPWPTSKHNSQPSMAVDIRPVFYDSKKRNFYYVAGVVKAVANMLYEAGKIEHRIRWGGDWDSDDSYVDQTFHDLFHFELI